MDQEELREIIWDDNPDFTEIEETMTDTDGWYIYYKKVVKQGSTGKFFEMSYGEGVAQIQEWEGDISMQEVFPKEVTKTIYVTKDKV